MRQILAVYASVIVTPQLSRTLTDEARADALPTPGIDDAVKLLAATSDAGHRTRPRAPVRRNAAAPVPPTSQLPLDAMRPHMSLAALPWHS